MEKYRRWTDETAGVNPFVAANTEKVSLLQKIITLTVAIVVKGSMFATLLPIIFILYLIPIDFVRQNAMRILLLLLGVYDKEDYSLQKADKNGKASIILSNHLCFLDPLYYMYRFPGCTFLGFYEDESGNNTYFILSPLKIFISMFTSLQIFYKQGKGHPTISSLIESSSLKKGGKLVIFYEKIRTIGRGTIKMDKGLADDIYNLEKDALVCQMKYTVKKDSLFSLTTSALSVLLSALGTITPGNNIKLRAIKLDCKDVHSANELRESVNSMAVGALLETKPKSYGQFIEFYQKTQKQGYKLQE